jgi:integrase
MKAIVPPQNNTYEGNIFCIKGRFYWKVTPPGQDERKTIPLRPPGSKFATKDRTVAEILAGDQWEAWNRNSNKLDKKLSGLVRAYTKHVQTYYRKADGTLSSQADNCDHALRFLKPYHNDDPNEFGPLTLKKIQQDMLQVRFEESNKVGLARKTINNYTGIIKAMFKWGVSEERVMPNVYYALAAVDNLHKGRSGARETRKVTAVDLRHLAAIKPFCLPIIGDMVELQSLTGMRSDELCMMKAGQIDMSGPIWLYTPGHFKTEHLDNTWRIVPIGPRGQEILTTYLVRICPLLRPEGAIPKKIGDFIFSPIESDIRRRAEQTAKRKTPINAGNRPGTNRKENPLVKPAEHYSPGSYRVGVCRGIKAAQKAGLKVPDFHPHQIRHTAGTRVRSVFDLETAKAVLGHSDINTTGIYAEIDLKRAIEAAAKIG